MTITDSTISSVDGNAVELRYDPTLTSGTVTAILSAGVVVGVAMAEGAVPGQHTVAHGPTAATVGSRSGG